MKIIQTRAIVPDITSFNDYDNIILQLEDGLTFLLDKETKVGMTKYKYAYKYVWATFLKI